MVALKWLQGCWSEFFLDIKFKIQSNSNSNSKKKHHSTPSSWATEFSHYPGRDSDNQFTDGYLQFASKLQLN